jgi:hypothetical protein
MDDRITDALVGVLLGALIVIAVAFFSIDWGVTRIKTATVSVPPPLLFIPK